MEMGEFGRFIDRNEDFVCLFCNYRDGRETADYHNFELP